MSDRFELLSQQVTAARRSMADTEAESFFSSIKSDSSATEAETPAESIDLVASLGIATAPSTFASVPSSSPRVEEERAFADLRRQASLVTSFAVEELATPSVAEPVRAAAATRLIEECQRDPKTGRFILGVEVRRQELARLYKDGELPRAAHAPRPEAGRLEQLYQKLLAGKHIAHDPPHQRLRDAVTTTRSLPVGELLDRTRTPFTTRDPFTTSTPNPEPPHIPPAVEPNHRADPELGL